MSLAAMLAVAMYASVNVAYHGKRTAQNAVQPVRAATIAAELVTQDLQSVLPPTGQLAGPFQGARQDGAAPAGGEADVLDFYCIGEDATPDQQSHPMQEGIRLVELALRTDVQPPLLVRRVTRNLLTTIQPDVEEEVLARGVRSFTLRYFDGTTWYDAWDSTTALEGSQPQGGSWHWPERAEDGE